MIVVNFSTDLYRPGQKRLSESLNGHKQLMLNDYTVINSPTHQQSPYEFKIHAIEKAYGFDQIVLYCDASMYAVGDLSKIEAIIKNKGYFMQEAGHWVRDWCKPKTKEWFDLKPEEEATFKMFSPGLLGLDFNNPDAQLWFSAWKISALNGHFKGSWTNHRHDMTCGSIIAQRMGFEYERGGSLMAYIGPGYAEPEPGVVVYAQGIV